MEILNTNFSLTETFNCGQCFRWEKVQGMEENTYSGVSGTHEAVITEHNNVIELRSSGNDDAYWHNYFDLDTDYGSIIDTLSADPTLALACKEAPGIRILRQEPFEVLISFIISQNNNIGRISGIIKTLTDLFGEKGKNRNYFPTPEVLASLSVEELAPLRAGFRARYINDAAVKVNSGEISLLQVADMAYEPAKQELMKIVGVGPKVADCVLLFGFHKMDAFPKDVWIKRILNTYYKDGLPRCIKGYEGIAQQYLFQYGRTHQGEIKELVL